MSQRETMSKYILELLSRENGLQILHEQKGRLFEMEYAHLEEAYKQGQSDNHLCRSDFPNYYLYTYLNDIHTLLFGKNDKKSSNHSRSELIKKCAAPDSYYLEGYDAALVGTDLDGRYVYNKKALLTIVKLKFNIDGAMAEDYLIDELLAPSYYSDLRPVLIEIP